MSLLYPYIIIATSNIKSKFEGMTSRNLPIYTLQLYVIALYYTKIHHKKLKRDTTKTALDKLSR